MLQWGFRAIKQVRAHNARTETMNSGERRLVNVNSPGRLRLHRATEMKSGSFLQTKTLSRISSPEVTTESVDSTLHSHVMQMKVPSFHLHSRSHWWQVKQKDMQRSVILFCGPQSTEPMLQSPSFTFYPQAIFFPIFNSLLIYSFMQQVVTEQLLSVKHHSEDWGKGQSAKQKSFVFGSACLFSKWERKYTKQPGKLHNTSHMLRMKWEWSWDMHHFI
jgi:hypothetical protein